MTKDSGPGAGWVECAQEQLFSGSPGGSLEDRPIVSESRHSCRCMNSVFSYKKSFVYFFNSWEDFKLT